MSQCKVCGEPRSPFVMNNKTVCLRCDELLFDIEIECEEEVPVNSEQSKKNPQPIAPNRTVVKK